MHVEILFLWEPRRPRSSSTFVPQGGLKTIDGQGGIWAIVFLGGNVCDANNIDPVGKNAREITAGLLLSD